MKILKKLTETVAIPIIDAAVDLAIHDSDPRNQFFKAVWYSIKGSYGFLAAFMPEEAEDFMKQIGEHRDKISTELLKSKEFEQALIITFDALIRTRNERKRQIVKRVFFKLYIPSNKHSKFELERFYQTSQQITLKDVDYLRFIEKELFPRKFESAKEKLRLAPNQFGLTPVIKDFLSKEVDSSHVRAYLKEEIDLKIPESYDFFIEGLNKVGRRVELDDYIAASEENNAELNSLGIFRTIPTFDYTGYIITKYGEQYIEYMTEK